MRRDEFLVQFKRPGRHSVHSEVFAEFARRSAEAVAKRAVANQRFQCGGETGDVALSDDMAINFLVDEFCSATDLSGDYRQATKSGFDKHVRKRLIKARQRKHVEPGHRPGTVRRAGPDDAIRYTKFRGLVPKYLFVRAATDDHESGQRLRLGDNCKGGDQKVDRFLGFEAPDESDCNVLRAQAEFCSDRRPIGIGQWIKSIRYQSQMSSCDAERNCMIVFSRRHTDQRIRQWGKQSLDPAVKESLRDGQRIIHRDKCVRRIQCFTARTQGGETSDRTAFGAVAMNDVKWTVTENDVANSANRAEIGRMRFAAHGLAVDSYVLQTGDRGLEPGLGTQRRIDNADLMPLIGECAGEVNYVSTGSGSASLYHEQNFQ